MKKDRHTIFSSLKALTGIVILSGLISCESVLFIELEESDKLIVVNGAISPDSLVKVQVSRTRHILDNAGLPVLDKANVSLYHDEMFVENLDYIGNGYYSTESFKPSIGENYVITVENQGLPSVTSGCVIPEPVRISSIDTSTVIIEYTGYDYYYYNNEGFLQFDLTINDPPGRKNYYLLILYAERSLTRWRDTTVIIIDSIFYGGQWNYFPRDSVYQVGDIIPQNDIPSFYTEDIVLEARTNSGALFSDQLFDGNSYSFRGRIQKHFLESADSALLSFRLHSISESYYKYLKSRKKHYDTREDYLAVPVIVYNNIESGVGFFGGYSSDVMTITTFVPEYRYEYWYYDDYY